MADSDPADQGVTQKRPLTWPRASPATRHNAAGSTSGDGHQWDGDRIAALVNYHRYLLTGRRMSATTAFHYGLDNEVVEHEQLDRCVSFAEKRDPIWTGD